MLQIVVDTNVLVSALRSQFGASYAIVQQLGAGRFEVNLSVPLVMEYEAVLKRMHKFFGLNFSDIDDFLDYICEIGTSRRIHYLWRPFLPDPADDMLLELAVSSQSSVILTHNVAHFRDSVLFGIQAVTPGAFLRLLEQEQ